MSAFTLASEENGISAEKLTALGNLHFPSVAAPEPDVLHQHHSLNLFHMADGTIVLFELSNFSDA